MRFRKALGSVIARALRARLRTADSNRLSLKWRAPIASVAAFPAQPLAALPPYGCGVPLAGSERLAGLQQGRHSFYGARSPDLSLRGGHRPTWQSREGTPDPYRPPLKRCWPPDLSLRGGRRPTWQSHATGHVFAGSTLLSTPVLRDSHVASLLGNDTSGWCGGAPEHVLRLNAPLLGAHRPQGARRSPYKRHTKIFCTKCSKAVHKISRRGSGGSFGNLRISLRAYKAEWPAGWYRLKPYNSGNASVRWSH